MPATLASAHYPHTAIGPAQHITAEDKESLGDMGTTKDLSTAKDGKSLAAQLKTLHQKASRALILGQGDVAWQHCRAAVEHCNIERLTSEYGSQQARQLCCRLWILYICVVSSVAEVAEEDGGLRAKHGALAGFPVCVRGVWDEIMAAFGGCAGSVDSEVLVPTVLLCLKLRDARTARDIVEAWLATLSDETMYLLQSSGNGIGGTARQQQRSMAQASYLRVCELYTLHILPLLGDFPSAYDFLSVSMVVSDPAKGEFTKRLDSLRNPPPARKRKTAPKKRAAKPKPAKSVVEDSGVEPDAGASKASAGEVKSSTQPAAKPLPALATLGPRAARTGKLGARRPGVKSGALVRRPRSTLGIAWQVVRRLMSRWGFTLFTLAVAVAVIRLITQRFRLPHFFTAVYRKLWNTVKMGTQVTYI